MYSCLWVGPHNLETLVPLRMMNVIPFQLKMNIVTLLAAVCDLRVETHEHSCCSSSWWRGHQKLAFLHDEKCNVWLVAIPGCKNHHHLWLPFPGARVMLTPLFYDGNPVVVACQCCTGAVRGELLEYYGTAIITGVVNKTCIYIDLWNREISSIFWFDSKRWQL